MMLICNAFSLNMLDDPGPNWPTWTISVVQMDLDDVRDAIGGDLRDEEWAWGHEQSAPIVCDMLGIPHRPARRVDVRLGRGDHLTVGQYVGPRLPEGATSLPEGAEIKFFVVHVA